MANYLTKKDLMAAIHASKITFSHFTEPRFSTYHHIVGSIDELTPSLVDEVVERLATFGRKSTRMTITPAEVVIRVMDDSHVPDDPTRIRKARGKRPDMTVVNFPPFKHFVLKDGEFVEVGRSHWKGDLETGVFSTTHGRITDQLARGFMMLTERIATKGNFRGYSYKDEMIGHAIVQLCQNGLMFNEYRSENPFAFFTTAVSNSFIRILNQEKRERDYRDAELANAGLQGSHRWQGRDS